VDTNLAKALFASLDSFNQGSIYNYILLSVIDSHRDPSSFDLFPVSFNDKVPIDRRHMWEAVASRLKPIPLYKVLRDRLSQKLTDADWSKDLKAILGI
jgi:hypothetical protein